MNLRLFTKSLALTGLFVLTFGNLAFGQGQGGQIPVDGGGQVPVQQPVAEPLAFEGGEGNDGDVDFEDAATLDFQNDREDTRNQGFIGPTSTRLGLQGYVGAGSVLGPVLATEPEGVSYGGEFGGFSGDNSRSAVVPSPSNSGFQAATPLGSTVERQNVRARLMPSFFSPTVAPARVQNQFVSVVARQPVAQSLVGRFSIQVRNKTAYLQGAVNNQREADYIVRQLRLQPGVYRIVNQLQVLAQ